MRNALSGAGLYATHRENLGGRGGGEGGGRQPLLKKALAVSLHYTLVGY
jgi:hypothetical protein